MASGGDRGATPFWQLLRRRNLGSVSVDVREQQEAGMRRLQTIRIRPAGQGCPPAVAYDHTGMPPAHSDHRHVLGVPGLRKHASTSGNGDGSMQQGAEAEARDAAKWTAYAAPCRAAAWHGSAAGQRVCVFKQQLREFIDYFVEVVDTPWGPPQARCCCIAPCPSASQQQAPGFSQD